MTNIFCYWYRTKVRTTFLFISFVSPQLSLPPPPISMLPGFWTAVGAGIFRTKVRTTKHTFFTTLKLGGRGVRYLQMRFRESRYMFPFRVPSWVVRTFVRHLSDSQMFVVCRSASKRCSLVSSASKTFVALDEKWHVLPSGEGGDTCVIYDRLDFFAIDLISL